MSSFPLHPQLISFGDVHCCSMREAFQNRAHAHLLEDLGEIISPRLALILGQIFIRTRQLSFVPRPQHKLFYSSLAKAEKRYLEALGNIKLACGHMVEEHLDAIKSVLLNIAKEKN